MEFAYDLILKIYDLFYKYIVYKIMFDISNDVFNYVLKPFIIPDQRAIQETFSRYIKRKLISNNLIHMELPRLSNDEKIRNIKQPLVLTADYTYQYGIDTEHIIYVYLIIGDDKHDVLEVELKSSDEVIKVEQIFWDLRDMYRTLGCFNYIITARYHSYVSPEHSAYWYYKNEILHMNPGAANCIYYIFQFIIDDIVHNSSIDPHEYYLFYSTETNYYDYIFKFYLNRLRRDYYIHIDQYMMKTIYIFFRKRLYPLDLYECSENLV